MKKITTIAFLFFLPSLAFSQTKVVEKVKPIIVVVQPEEELDPYVETTYKGVEEDVDNTNQEWLTDHETFNKRKVVNKKSEKINTKVPKKTTK